VGACLVEAALLLGFDTHAVDPLNTFLFSEIGTIWLHVSAATSSGSGASERPSAP